MDKFVTWKAVELGVLAMVIEFVILYYYNNWRFARKEKKKSQNLQK